MTLTRAGTVFGLSKVEIKLPADPSTGWLAIPYVQSAAFKGSVTEVELTGDNQIQGYLYHSMKGQLVVKANQTAMAVFEKLANNGTGSVAGSTVTQGSQSSDTLLFGTQTELIPQIVTVRAQMPIVHADGTRGNLTTYWFRAFVATAFESFPGGTYGAVTDVTFTFNCVRSNNDENNVPITAVSGGAFGRIEFSQ